MKKLAPLVFGKVAGDIECVLAFIDKCEEFDVYGRKRKALTAGERVKFGLLLFGARVDIAEKTLCKLGVESGELLFFCDNGAEHTRREHGRAFVSECEFLFFDGVWHKFPFVSAYYTTYICAARKIHHKA